MAAKVRADSSSPWFSGHFPDDPILPGIAQLKMVVELIATSSEEELRLTGISRVKFRKIVRPGDQLDVFATPGKLKNNYNFRILIENEEVCSGVMSLLPKKK